MVESESGGIGSNREGVHRKLIMGAGLIAELREPRTDPPARPVVALAEETRDGQTIEDMRMFALIARGCDVMELYSPKRIGRVCTQHGLGAGPALDLRTGYDFSKAADPARAMAIYHEQKPELVTLSLPCTVFS